MRQIDPDRGLANVLTLEEWSYRDGWYLRVFGGVFLIFAAGALLLASIGIYAVVAQTTARRTQEIGIRMALEQRRPTSGGSSSSGGEAARRGNRARSRDRGGGHAADGRAPLRRVATDPVVFSSVIGIIALVGLAACWLPARRAARLDPLKALRHE